MLINICKRLRLMLTVGIIDEDWEFSSFSYNSARPKRP